MGVVGIVLCEVLELEFAYLLSTDPDLRGVSVLDDPTAGGFIKALHSMGRIVPRRILTLEGFNPRFPGRTEVVARVLEIALHSRKWMLQEGLVKAVRELAPHVDCILLGYGLCGNALQDPYELLGDAGVPLFIPMDGDHLVDDCVGLIIGGRTPYYEEQCKEPGTFFMIPGMTTHWRRFFETSLGRFGLHMAKRIFKGYKRSLLVSTPVLLEAEMRERIEEFNTMLDLNTEVRKGTLNALALTWDRAKNFVSQ